MKVLFLAPANSIHTVKWVNAFVKKGYEVYLIYNLGHHSVKDCIDNRVKQFCLKYAGGKAYYLNVLQLKRLVKKINPDIVNAHYASGYGTLARVAKLSPLVLSVWGSDVYEFPFLSKINNHIIKKNLLFADQLASTSECMAKKIKEVIGNSEVNITITPFGVDLQKFAPEKFHNNKRENLKVGVIKSLEPLYGIEDFLKAMSIVIKELESEIFEKNVLVEIYGEGSQKENLQNLVKHLGIDACVEFKGRIANSKVPEVLSDLDVFCNMTKTFESFGVSVVEAMAMKVPVIVTNVEGTVEVTKNGSVGIVVESGDVQQMAQSIKELLLNKDKRIQLGLLGRKRVEEEYNWEENVKIMEKLYFETVKC